MNKSKFKNFSLRNRKLLEDQKTESKKKERCITNDNKVKNKKLYHKSIIIPKEFFTEMKKIKIYYVSPSLNIAGNYNNYIEQIMYSMIHLSNLNFDIIFKEKKEKKKKKSNNKKLLLLDLDETLIHSEDKLNYLKNCNLINKKMGNCFHKEIKFKEGENEFSMEIFIRPFLNEFLEKMNENFDLGIFTAALKNYAEAVLKIIDPSEKYFKIKLYRDSCINVKDKIFIKDLRIIENYDIKDIILVDNSLYSFYNNLKNGVLVNSFFYDGNDNQLIFAQNYILNALLLCDDVRIVNEDTYKFTKQFDYYKSLYSFSDCKNFHRKIYSN